MIRSGFLFWLKAAALLISHPTDLSNIKKTSVPWSPTVWPKERLSFLSPLLLHLGQGLLSLRPSPLSPKLHLRHRPKSSRMPNPPLCSGPASASGSGSADPGERRLRREHASGLHSGDVYFADWGSRAACRVCRNPALNQAIPEKESAEIHFRPSVPLPLLLFGSLLWVLPTSLTCILCYPCPTIIFTAYI